MRRRLQRHLRSRTKKEQQYAKDLDKRVGFAASNVEKFVKFEQEYKRGTMNSRQIALRTQKLLEQERKLDSDYEESEEIGRQEELNEGKSRSQ